jgi:hypothetical protein
MTSKERLARNLRGRVRVSRRFDVESLGEGREKHTCRECKTSEIVVVAPPGADLRVIERLTAYRSRGGVTGVCKTCSKARAAELYPLPGEGWRR